MAESVMSERTLDFKEVIPTIGGKHSAIFSAGKDVAKISKAIYMGWNRESTFDLAHYYPPTSVAPKQLILSERIGFNSQGSILSKD